MINKKKVAVVLAGCGHKDGSEIHEAVLTLLAIAKMGAEAQCYAPAIKQTVLTNHLTGEAEEGERNCLVEASRIARGKIADLVLLNASCADALIFPGGFGAALNLSNFAMDGANYNVHPEVERVILDFHQSKKPMGFICIAPVLAARVLGTHQVRLTIGDEENTARLIEKTGARHVNHGVESSLTDREHKIVSTPAYMLANNIVEVEQGIHHLVTEVLSMI